MEIYLDHNATSPPSDEHLVHLQKVLKGSYGNPSSLHAKGRKAQSLIYSTQKALAQSLGFLPQEVIFLSGGTEANNTVILGLKPQYPISSAIEHPCILKPLESLKRPINYINPTSLGIVTCEDLKSAITPETDFITLMIANNETGAIQEAKLFGDFLHKARWEDPSLVPQGLTQEHLRSLHFHVDAIQAYGKIPFTEWTSLGYDSVSLSIHKIGGVQGIGALLLRKKTSGSQILNPLLYGGPQQRNRRPGTENLLGIASFSLIHEELQKDSWWRKISQLREYRDHLWSFLEPHVHMFSPQKECLPNTLYFACKGGEDLILEMDMSQIYATAGSACSSGVQLESHVLKAMGISQEISKHAIRLSLGLDFDENQLEKLKSFLQGKMARIP